jgi:hypothetical protein
MAAITITNDGLNLMAAGLMGTNNSKITYVALGTSSTAPTVTDHLLGAEIFRKAVTSYAVGVSPGELVVNMYLAPGDAVGDNIQEVGFFGGSTATAKANTGVLVARGLYVHSSKSNLESIVFPFDLTIHV